MFSKKALKVKEKGEDLVKTAEKMFEAAGKEAYYLGDKAIRNLEELKDNIEAFTEKEAEWVASWIEYLGDSKTAQKIRSTPGNLKQIVVARYHELKQHYKRQP